MPITAAPTPGKSLITPPTTRSPCSALPKGVTEPCGLLGILLGEQVVPLLKSFYASSQQAETIRVSCSEHLLGRLPANSEATERSA